MIISELWINNHIKYVTKINRVANNCIIGKKVTLKIKYNNKNKHQRITLTILNKFI